MKNAEMPPKNSDRISPRYWKTKGGALINATRVRLPNRFGGIPNQQTITDTAETHPNPQTLAEFLARAHPPKDVLGRRAHAEATVPIRKAPPRIPLMQLPRGDTVIHPAAVSRVVQAYAEAFVAGGEVHQPGDLRNMFRAMGLPEDVIDASMRFRYGGKKFRRFVRDKVKKVSVPPRPVDIRALLDGEERHPPTEHLKVIEKGSAAPIMRQDSKTLAKGRVQLAPPREPRVAWTIQSDGFNTRDYSADLLALKEQLLQPYHTDATAIDQPDAAGDIPPVGRTRTLLSTLSRFAHHGIQLFRRDPHRGIQEEEIVVPPIITTEDVQPKREHVEPEAIIHVTTTSRPSRVIWPPPRDAIYYERRKRRTVWPPRLIWPPVIPVDILKGRQPDFDYTAIPDKPTSEEIR
jgi:hypothetical protein